KSYVKDTEGFYDVEGINLGYPAVDTEYDVKDGEITVNVSLLAYMDETIKKEDVDDFFDKYKEVEINGKTLEEDKSLYAMKDELLKELDDDDYVFLDNTVHNIALEMEL